LAENADALHRFEREAKAVAALSHPNILAIHDFGNEQGVSYAVMELLEGETVRVRLARAALSWREAVGIGIAISEGLAAAHAKDIIHRDLKPENIFLTSDGGVKILDFGIARIKHVVRPDAVTATSSLPGTTQPGAVLGTIGYMSPEQVRGEVAEAPSDIFSLGCVLHEMVAGKRPFARGNTMETLAAILRDKPPVLADRNLPAAYRRLTRQCLEKSPDARPQSARDVAVALRAILRQGAGVSITLPRLATRQRPALWLAVAIVTLVLGGLAYWFWIGRRGTAIDSLAILPLINASGDTNLDYLSDGITESLINALSQLPALRVIGRGTAFSYKGKQVDPRQVGRELNVRAVLTGRMAQRGDDLNIQVDLVNTQDGAQLWGERYNRKLSDLSAVQEDVARRTSEKLRLRLSGDEQRRLTKRYGDKEEAHLLYLKGRHYWNNWTGGEMQKGLGYFEHALQADPNYAPAWIGLADAYYGLSGRYMPSKEMMPKIRAAALKALEIDETLGEAHASLALVKMAYEWNWQEAEKEFRRAVELTPGSGAVHFSYGLYLVVTERPDEALKELRLAQELDPLSPSTAVVAAWPYYYAPLPARQYDLAASQVEKIIELNPNFHAAYGFISQVYWEMAMYDQAIAMAEKAKQLEDAMDNRAILVAAYAAAGRKIEARKELAELLGRSKRDHLSPVHNARIYAALGEKEDAFVWLQKAFDEKEEELTLIKVDPRLDSLRSDPRFADLLRRVNLAP
jgi:TolB-like protein/Tfp pilus assembly protein PilF